MRDLLGHGLYHCNEFSPVFNEWESATLSSVSLTVWSLCPVVFRFILDDSALYLSDKCESDTVDLRRGGTQGLCVGLQSAK